MHTLSVDVGIHNLALCLLETSTPDCAPTIRAWEVIDLAPQQMCLDCGERPAALTKGEVVVCRPCARKLAPKLIAITPKIRMSCIEPFDERCLRRTGCLRPEDKCGAAAIRRFMRERALLPYKHPPAGSVPLQRLAKNLAQGLGAFLAPTGGAVDKVAIENQIGPQAIRMKALQAMITQHLVTAGQCRPSGIMQVSAQEKLRAFPGHKGLSYGQRKMFGMKACEHMLTLDGERGSAWLSAFLQNPKRDDLADAYLQGIAVLTADGFAPPAGWASSDVRIT